MVTVAPGASAAPAAAEPLAAGFALAAPDAAGLALADAAGLAAAEAAAEAGLGAAALDAGAADGAALPPQAASSISPTPLVLNRDRILGFIGVLLSSELPTSLVGRSLAGIIRAGGRAR